MKETSESMHRAATLAATQIDRLAESDRRQEEAWRGIQDSMRKYQEVFGQVNNVARDLSLQIDQHLRTYRETVRDGFDGLIKLVDNDFAKAVSRLGSSVNELDD